MARAYSGSQLALTVERRILSLRGHRVLLDYDLASLYGVETRALKQAVKRNLDRFPADFMFQLTPEEYHFLKSQIVTSKNGSGGKQKLPLVFTENGLAMLSCILNSDRAISVNIAIMRIFTRLRSFLLLEQELRNEIKDLKKGTSQMFKIVFERLDNLEDTAPSLNPNRKKIGVKTKD